MNVSPWKKLLSWISCHHIYTSRIILQSKKMIDWFIMRGKRAAKRFLFSSATKKKKKIVQTEEKGSLFWSGWWEWTSMNGRENEKNFYFIFFWLFFFASLFRVKWWCLEANDPYIHGEFIIENVMNKMLRIIWMKKGKRMKKIDVQVNVKFIQSYPLDDRKNLNFKMRFGRPRKNFIFLSIVNLSCSSFLLPTDNFRKKCVFYEKKILKIGLGRQWFTKFKFCDFRENFLGPKIFYLLCDGKASNQFSPREFQSILIFYGLFTWSQPTSFFLNLISRST